MLYAVPASIRNGHSSSGPLVGEVCLALAGATQCPVSSPLFNSTNALPVHQLQIAVLISGSQGLTGFDIILKTNHSVLSPQSIDLTGTVLQGTPPLPILAECLSGHLVLGSSCSPQDSLDTLELAATSSTGAPPTNPPTTGLLFTATYNVNGTAQSIPIGFQTGCSGTSIANVCITVDGLTGAIPETAQGAKFTDLPYFDVQGFNQKVITHPPLGSMTIEQRSVDTTLGINVTTVNGFNGVVQLVPTLPASATNITVSVSPNSAWVNNTDASSVNFTPKNVVTISVGGLAPPGRYGINFTGTNAGIPQPNVLTITLIVPTPDFAVSVSPGSISFNVTATGQATVTLSGIGNFTGTVNLSLSTPIGLNASLVSAQLTVPPKDGSITTTIHANSTITGGYTVNLTATSGTTSHSTLVNVSVEDFVMTAVYPTGSGNLLTMAQGKNNSLIINFGTVAGILFDVQVTVGNPIVQSTSSYPKPSLGATVSCKPRIQNLTSNGQSEIAGQSRCVVVGNVPGNYTVIVPASSGRITNSATFNVEVLGPDFAVVPAVSVLSIPVGNSTSVNVSLISELGFAGPLTQIQAVFTSASTCTSPPPAGFHTHHNNATLTNGATVIDSLSINTTTSTPTGICFLLVSATYSPTALTRSATMTIVITATASPHNLEVYSVTTDTQSTTIGTDVKISVTVINLGTVTENSTVIALVGSLDVGEANFTNLAPGANITETIVWKTSTFAAGTYSIGGQVLPATGQTNSQNGIVRMPTTLTLNASNTSVLQSPYFEPAIIAVLVVLVGLVGFMFLQARRKQPAKP